MELNDRERATLNDLFNIAWQAGAVKSPATGQELEALRFKLIGNQPIVPPKPPEMKEVK